LGLLVLGLWSCADDEAAAPAGPAAAAPVKAAVAKTNAPEAAPENPQYTYSPVGKRDPFRSYLADLAAAQVKASDQPRKSQPTEEYEMDQYRLTGLITGTAQPKAMVEDPKGVGHSLTVGSHLGKNGGRVTRISNKGIIVVEETFDATGQRVRVPITIPLRIEEITGVFQQ